jgi:ATP-binding cassette subfamily F protein uup
MRLGIVGPNGSGKTTLLKILAGEMPADIGTIKYADDLRIVYFDQHRQKLNPNDTLRQALAPNSDTVFYRGSHIHVNSWAKRFLFSPERLDMPVKQLSGGERARIGIAKLMLQPADILFLDEPTNDLDIATLETLEESLNEFPGAIALITHDRALLDKITTCVIGLGVPGKVPLLADYHQWDDYLEQHKASMQPSAAKKSTFQQQESAPQKTPPKLSYKEKKELDQMEEVIHKTEADIARLEEEMHACTSSDRLDDLQKVCEKIALAQRELERLFHRWQELEDKKS